MSTDLQALQPIPSNWFSPVVEYEGVGRAEFTNPKGFIEVSVKASFREHGETNIRMAIDTWKTDDPSVNLLPQFLPLGGANPCSQLVVKTPLGILTTQNEVFYSASFQLFAQKEKGSSWLELHVREAKFETHNAASPVYWVLPLSNFISDFAQSDSILDSHPLRIFPCRKITDGLNGPERALAELQAHRKNRLIIFEFGGELGFVEALPDYETKKEQLTSGCQRNTLTAVMIGAITDKPCNSFAELEQWLPMDFLHLLGIATGSDVGAPWIEIRDASANLVCRIHVNLGTPSYIRGHRAIHEGLHRGIGHLLTQSLSSPYWGTPLLRVLPKQVLRGGFQDQVVLEDRLNYLCRGFETLARYFKLDTQHLLDGLDASNQALVRQFLGQTSQQLLALTKTSAVASDPVKVRQLQHIAGRVRDASGVAKDFGLTVIQLLDRFSLPDAKIVDAFYSTTPTPRGKGWAGELSFYRGTVVHEGYFDIVGKRHDVDDIVVLVNHLHDILLRIIFKVAGYIGTYDPTVGENTLCEEADWVTSATSPSRLGYHRKQFR